MHCILSSIFAKEAEQIDPMDAIISSMQPIMFILLIKSDTFIHHLNI